MPDPKGWTDGSHFLPEVAHHYTKGGEMRPWLQFTKSPWQVHDGVLSFWVIWKCLLKEYWTWFAMKFWTGSRFWHEYLGMPPEWIENNENLEESLDTHAHGFFCYSQLLFLHSTSPSALPEFNNPAIREEMRLSHSNPDWCAPLSGLDQPQQINNFKTFLCGADHTNFVGDKAFGFKLIKALK